MINRVHSIGKYFERRKQKLIQWISNQSGSVLAELFSPFAGAFACSLIFSAFFISVFGLLEETAPELER